MSLLAFEDVDKRFADAAGETVVLERASFDVCAGELIGVRGARGAGKSTLLKLAAGLERPDGGAVRFAGRDLAKLSLDERALLWREELVLVSFDERLATRRARVIEYVALALLSADRVTHREARGRARHALERVEALACSEAELGELSQEDLLRVEIAGALARRPVLLLLDEPPALRTPSRRAALWQLLRSLGGERGRAAILVSEELDQLRGVRRMMAIGGGRLRTLEEPGEVLPFPARAAGPGAS